MGVGSNRLKGISPLVATVIVLAFTIAVAGIVGVFLTGFTTTQTGAVGGTGAKLTACAGSALAFNFVKVFCKTSAAGTNWVNTTVSYSTGAKSLSNITLQLVGGGASGKIANQSELVVGDFFAWTTNMTTPQFSVTCPPDLVRVTGVCLNETIIQADCNKGDACYTQVFS